MNVEQLERTLNRTEEIEITVEDRESGKPVTHPVWFVLEGDHLSLVPVRGSDSEWFRNAQKSGKIRISADDAAGTFRARPITEPAKVRRVVEKFRGKYGADQVKQYYSKLDVAVDVLLVTDARES